MLKKKRTLHSAMKYFFVFWGEGGLMPCGSLFLNPNQQLKDKL